MLSAKCRLHLIHVGSWQPKNGHVKANAKKLVADSSLSGSRWQARRFDCPTIFAMQELLSRLLKYSLGDFTSVTFGRLPFHCGTGRILPLFFHTSPLALMFPVEELDLQNKQISLLCYETNSLMQYINKGWKMISICILHSLTGNTCHCTFSLTVLPLLTVSTVLILWLIVFIILTVIITLTLSLLCCQLLIFFITESYFILITLYWEG